ncbi:hypothetical protein BJ508DRAFT_415092 [Ascobolus immersus RN42]|uniref:non-specific serine/threonine protein kinase n=1 Tax=Ascobolus immersus RN42 TaxID=1160509 RepID=A0A3N4I3Y2_ASCIM|nr:hypothetical protein BJ508DRAFT_415092 [Ascobolus immersus RN42]
MADYDPFAPRKSKHKQKTYGKSTKAYDSNRLGRKLWVDLKPEDDIPSKSQPEEQEDDDDDVEAFLKVVREKAAQRQKGPSKSDRTDGEQKEEVEELVGDLSRLDIGPLSPLSEHEDFFNHPSTPKQQGHRKSLSKTKGSIRDDEEKENIDPVESLLTEFALEDSAVEAGQLTSPRCSSHGSRRRSQKSSSDRRQSNDSMQDKGFSSTDQPLHRRSRSRGAKEGRPSDEAEEEVSEKPAPPRRPVFAVEIPTRRRSSPSESRTSTAGRSKSKSKRSEERPTAAETNGVNGTPNKPHRIAPIAVSPLVPLTPDRKGGLRKKKDQTSGSSIFSPAPEASTSYFPSEKETRSTSSGGTPKDLLDVVNASRQPSQPSRQSSRTSTRVEEQYEEEEETEEDYFNRQLDELLEMCTEHDIVDFTQYIKGMTRKSRIKKLGEASYSEVYLQSFSNSNRTNVLKIIPFGEAEQCMISQILQEVRITQTMAQFDGFIGFEGAVVAQGQYPQQLLREWHKYDEERGSENYCPDTYGDEQLFIIILLENGGTDLEHFEIKSWSEAKEIFKQTAQALAVGESEVEFEHRDLHYGNVVIKRIQPSKPNPRHTKFTGDEPVETLLDELSIKEKKEPELKVALIDYTLSRASIADRDGNGPTYLQLEDPELFAGKGIYQFEIYRFMRRHLYSETHIESPEEEDWSIYLPKTNVFWLHYILHILLNEKELTRPAGSSRRGAGNSGLPEADERAYRDLDKIFKTIDPRRRRYARGGEEQQDISCAEELVWWAENEGLL